MMVKQIKPISRIDALKEQQKLFPNSTLPTICMEIHMALNGSADPWPDTKIIDVKHMLEMRIKTWEWSIAQDHHPDSFDFVVYQMVIITLTSILNYLRNISLSSIGVVKN